MLRFNPWCTNFVALHTHLGKWVILIVCYFSQSIQPKLAGRLLSQNPPSLHALIWGTEVGALNCESHLRNYLRPIGGDLRVAIVAEGSVHGPGMDGVRRDAATLEPSAQLPDKHYDGELWKVKVCSLWASTQRQPSANEVSGWRNCIEVNLWVSISSDTTDVATILPMYVI